MIPIHKLDDDASFNDACDIAERIDEIVGREAADLAMRKYGGDGTRACAIAVAAMTRSLVSGVRTQGALVNVTLTDDECNILGEKITKLVTETMLLNKFWEITYRETTGIAPARPIVLIDTGRLRSSLTAAASGMTNFAREMQRLTSQPSKAKAKRSKKQPQPPSNASLTGGETIGETKKRRYDL